MSHSGAEVKAESPVYSIYSEKLDEVVQEYRLLYRQSLMKHSEILAKEHGTLLMSLTARLFELGLSEKQLAFLQSADSPKSGLDVFSNYSGIVTEMYATEGQYVDRGDPVMQIADLFEMWYVFEIYDTDRSAIRIGQSVEISIPSVLNPVSGSISFIDPNGSPTTRSVQARVPLQNPVIRIQGVKQQILERNAYAEGVVEVSLGSALSVPRESVVDSGNRAVVFVLAPADSIVQRPVRIGRRGAAYWEVLDGLTSGESVARTGLILLEGELGLGSSQTD